MVACIIFDFYHIFHGNTLVLKSNILYSKPASAEKQRIAAEVASMLKLSVGIATSSTERLVFCFPLLHLQILGGNLGSCQSIIKLCITMIGVVNILLSTCKILPSELARSLLKF